MPTKMIAGKIVQVNEEGYMTNPAEWNKEIAVEIAKEEGLVELTPDHWKVIDYARRSAVVEWCRSHLAHHHLQCRCDHQGAFHPLPQGSRQESRPYRRSRQARRLCVKYACFTCRGTISCMRRHDRAPTKYNYPS